MPATGGNGDLTVRRLVVLTYRRSAVLRLPFGRDGFLRDSRQGSTELSRVSLAHLDVGNSEVWSGIIVTDDTSGPQPCLLYRSGRLNERHIQGLARLVDYVLQGSHPDVRGKFTSGNGDLSVCRSVVLTRRRSAVFSGPGEGDIVNGR